MRSLRHLAKHWKLSAIAVFSLSIAMALGVVSLSISNTFLMLPPPAPEPDRLVMIYSRSPSEAIGQFSYPDYKYLQENNHVFTDVAAAPNSISMSENRSPETGEIKFLTRPVSGNYLNVMGIRPLLGRFFTPEDEDSKTGVGVMTYTTWVRLGSDPEIVGKSIIGSTMIIGVLPKEFTGTLFGVDGDMLVPLSKNDPWRNKREERHLFLTARLKPGVTRRQAQAEIETLSGQLATQYPKEDKDHVAVVTRATLLPPDGVATAQWIGAILMSIVLLVLLIACANVANLLLAVAVGRKQEASIKLALGASRRRLIREFLKESAVICGASAVVGYVIAAALMARYASIQVMLPIMGTYTFSLHLRMDATVVAFTIGLMLVAILATGLAPALYASSVDLAQMLSGEIVVGGSRKSVRRNVLVIVQVAVCTLVLVGMGLCQRSLYNLRHADPGFSARNLVAVQLFPMEEHITEVKGRELYQRVRDRIAELPGVELVSLAADLPLLGGGSENVQLPDGSKKVSVGQNFIDPDYFATFDIKVLAGRVFNSFDREKTPDVVVINHKMAETFWPGQDAVGKSVSVGDAARKVMVIGIVADGKYEDMDEAPKPFLYSALSQHYREGMNVVARTKGDPRLWVGPVTEKLRGMELMALNPVTFDGWLNLALVAERATAACVAGLSGLGLLLAVIGLFGAISYSVSERRKELGIRVALGARPDQLMEMVLRQTLRIAGSGVVLGLLLGVGVTMALRSQFYQVSAVEWTVLIPVCLAMLGVSLLVAYFSARPWIRVDPMEAVRHA